MARDDYVVRGPFRRVVTVRHYGPGPHPGTGTEQEVHAGGGAARVSEEANPEAGTQKQGPPEGMTFWTEATGAYSGQVNGFVRANDANGNYIGHLDYQLFEGVAHVAWIEVLPEYRRRGIGSALVRRLQEEFPHNKISFGMRTTEGTALWQALRRQGMKLRHYGPGPHPGTGTPQEVHAGDGATVAEEARPRREHAGEPEEYRADLEGYDEKKERQRVNYEGPFGRETIGEYLDRHGIERSSDGLYHYFHGTPRKTGATTDLRPSSYLAMDEADARFYTARDRDLDSQKDVRVISLWLRPSQIDGGVFATLREGISLEAITRHYGPGPHPGTGTEQEVHAGGGATVSEETKVEGGIIKITGWHTILEGGRGFSMGLMPQRGPGTYISLDHPFSPGAGIVRDVEVNLRADQILDPNGLIPGTDTEKSRRDWSAAADEVNAMGHERVSELGGGFGAVQEVEKRMGYRAEAGWIEPGLPSHGRELVVWNREDVVYRSVAGLLRRVILKHYGPGAHRGTGTEQQVHAGGRAAVSEEAVPQAAGVPESRVRLTRSAISNFIRWSSSRYNEYPKSFVVGRAWHILNREMWRQLPAADRDYQVRVAGVDDPVTRPIPGRTNEIEVLIEREVYDSGTYTEGTGGVSYGSYLINGREGYIAGGHGGGPNSPISEFHEVERRYFVIPRQDAGAVTVERYGTKKSGHWGHKGIPHHRGGSLPSKGEEPPQAQGVSTGDTSPLQPSSWRGTVIPDAVADRLLADYHGLLASEWEVAELAKDNGDVLLNVRGGKDYVSLESEVMADCRAKGAGWLLHNHPNGLPLSESDIVFGAIEGLTGVVAVGRGHDGRVRIFSIRFDTAAIDRGVRESSETGPLARRNWVLERLYPAIGQCNRVSRLGREPFGEDWRREFRQTDERNGLLDEDPGVGWMMTMEVVEVQE